MIGHLMIAGATIVALTTGAPTTSNSPAPAAKAGPRHTEKRYTDHEGNKVIIRVDDQGKIVDYEARDTKDAKMETVQPKLQDLTVCMPRSGGAQFCQPLTFVSDGAFFKMGTASCTCCNVGGIAICYGGTCK